MLQTSASILSAAEGGGDRAVCAVRLYAPGPVERRPFHLAFLLDVSGSMDGDRIRAVKQTLHDVLDLLTPTDRLSLITYASDATMVLNSSPIADCIDSIRAAVGELRAEGGTNLEAGFLHLGRLVVPPDALVILTDGHCNMGARHPARLLQILYGVLSPTLPIHTIGYGADHNQRLLADLATTSHGSYGFAEEDALIPTILGDIVGSLATRVVQNVRVDCSGDGWSTSHKAVGDMIADRAHWVVFETTGAAEVPVLEVSWVTMAGATERARIAVGSEISAVEIAEQRDRVRVAEELERVVEDIMRGAYTSAKDRLYVLHTYLATSLAVGRPLHAQLVAQVVQYRADMENDTTALDEMTAPLLSRMLSRQTTLTIQRGVSSTDPAENVFSSPTQRRVARGLLDTFTQSMMAGYDESF